MKIMDLIMIYLFYYTHIQLCVPQYKVLGIYNFDAAPYIEWYMCYAYLDFILEF